MDELMMLILMHPFMWLIMLLFLVALGIRTRVRTTIAECKELDSDSGMTGGTMAEIILRETGVSQVQVVCMELKGGDHYSAADKTVYLCSETYYRSTIQALAQAAHQCGHAIQDKEEYCSMHVRRILITVLGIVGFLGIPLFIMGILNHFNVNAIQLAAFFIAMPLLFQMFSIPMELNASKRAMECMVQGELMPEYEREYCRKALNAAALTYLSSNALTAEVFLRIGTRR